MITGKKQAIKKITQFSDSQVVLSMAGVTGGLVIGKTMTEYADLKIGTIFEKVHHWFFGLIVSVLGLILSFSKYSKSAAFITAIGLGIAVTDLRDMGTQLNNLGGKEKLTEGSSIEDTLIKSPMIPTH